MSETQINCCVCGKFIGRDEIQNDKAHFHFEPDSHKGPEICEWTCAKCVESERTRTGGEG